MPPRDFDSGQNPCGGNNMKRGASWDTIQSSSVHKPRSQFLDLILKTTKHSLNKVPISKTFTMLRSKSP